jgi:L-asparaginase II
MANPVLVEVTRGGRVESRHTGSFVVMDADGGIIRMAGDVDAGIYPRSAIKGFQALPLIESGAADRFGLTDAEIALACSSHNGEPEHVALSASMLAKCGRDAGALECGPHWPMREAALRKLMAEGGEPSALHNNCSGKHAGFVCVACARGDDPKGYLAKDHPTMREVIAAVSAMTGDNLAAEAPATDGCSIPTYAMSLRSLAHGFARFGSGHGLARERAAAARRIRAAVAAEPFFVAGTGRFDTRAMQALGARAFTKTGAEGVFCAALPELGVGVALKCDDGSSRASEVMMAALLMHLLPLSEAEHAGLAPLRQPALTNWNGIHVGDIRPAGVLSFPERRP